MLSSTPSDYDAARDLVAALLTQSNGEYVLRIGQQPSHTDLFSGELTDESVNWSGTPRTTEEIGTLRTQIIKAVEEVGGKVRISVLFNIMYLIPLQRRPFYLRLSPVIQEYRYSCVYLLQMFL